MMNFSGEADDQPSGGGVIPSKSMVKVKLEIRLPDVGKDGNFDPLAKTFKPNQESGVAAIGLDCIFTVLSGRYSGSKIYSNMSLPLSLQPFGTQFTEKQVTGCRINGALLKGMVKAARGIPKGDTSQEAEAAQGFNTFQEIQGIEFGMIVTAKVNTYKGTSKLQNDFDAVVHVEDEYYQHIMGGGDNISEIPLPELPAGPGGNGSAPGPGQSPGPGPGQQQGPGPGTTYQPQPNQNQPQGQPNTQQPQGGGYQQANNQPNQSPPNQGTGHQTPNQQQQPNTQQQQQPNNQQPQQQPQGGGYQNPNPNGNPNVNPNQAGQQNTQGANADPQPGGPQPTWTNNGQQQKPNDGVPF